MEEMIEIPIEEYKELKMQANVIIVLLPYN